MTDNIEEVATPAKLDLSPKLPAPRLELRWMADYERDPGEGYKSWVCHYNLVIPLSSYDSRREVSPTEPLRDELTVNIGSTFTSTLENETPLLDGHLALPYRDGAHINWDNHALGNKLPMFVVWGDHAESLVAKDADPETQDGKAS